MTKPEFNVGDKVAWNYGVGKGKGHIVERVTKTTKLYGKNFKATPEEPKYRIKSDKNGKELIRNPETLELLKEDAAGDDNEGAEVDEVEDAENEKEEDPTTDVEGAEKKEEVKEALALKHQEVEAKARGVQVSKEKELGGEPLQQMPGAQMKLDMISGKAPLDLADDDADLSKIEVHHDKGPSLTGAGSRDDVEMEKTVPSNGAPHGLPHETVPQPNLDTVK